MIKVKNLSKTYKLSNGEEKVALNDVSLEINQGEILGIIGVSGSGKTTLVRTLRGVETFDEGKIIIDDVVVSPDSDFNDYNYLKEKTAIHLQRSFGLWPETVINNVIRKLYGAKYGDETATVLDDTHGEFYDEALELLKIVNLEDKKNHYALVLSGGEKQRLVLARQLAKKPKLLLLDEPATMSCPKTKQDTLDAIKNINELGVTVVLVSHLPEVHSYLSDRLILMESGEIKEEGNVDDILKDFLTEMDDIEEFDYSPSNEKLIEVKDIKKKFVLLDGGHVLDIDDVSFDVFNKEILTLMGPSGAGKTVLLRIMAGLELPDEGTVHFKFNDEFIDMNEPSIERLKVRKNLGIMHQEFALAHKTKIRDQIAARLGVKNDAMVRKAREKAEKMGFSDEYLDLLYQLTDLPESEAKSRLSQVDLDPNILDKLFPSFPEKEVIKFAKPIFEALDLPMDVLNRQSDELSGGQKVRASLAIVLASKPDYLFLDEPFGDLDPITLRTVTNSLKRINNKFSTTIIMISHHMNFIRELSTRSILMENGKITMDGDVDKLCDALINISHADYLLNE